MTQNEVSTWHEDYAKFTREFLARAIAAGATWLQCQEIIQFGDDETDEDIVNPLFPGLSVEGNGFDDINTTHDE